MIVQRPSIGWVGPLAGYSVKLSAQDLKELDEVSAPAWGYPYNFIGAREPW